MFFMPTPSYPSSLTMLTGKGALPCGAMFGSAVETESADVQFWLPFVQCRWHVHMKQFNHNQLSGNHRSPVTLELKKCGSTMNVSTIPLDTNFRLVLMTVGEMM